MIAGLEAITSGDLYLDDTHMNDVEPKDRDIAMVFQSYALYPHMSVYKNMAFGLNMKHIEKKEIDERILSAAKKLDLETYLDRKPRALSGGQQQRVALGRALVKKPKVFLMDEPLSNLDAKLRSQTRETIVNIHRDAGATTIYVTHDQVEAMTMGTKIVVMNFGVIQQIGTPEEIYVSPINMFVAGFIGSPAINFVEGVIEKGYFVSKAFKLALAGKHTKLLSDYEGKKVKIGIRPEFFQTEDEPIYQRMVDSQVEVTASFVERLGSEYIISGRINEEKVLAKIRFSHVINVGDKIKMSIDLDNVHFFDPETELAIR
jgi:multiple sugar transport system ATP-binding protein